MRRILASTTALCILSACAPAENVTATAAPLCAGQADLERRVHDAAQAMIDAHNFPGISVAVTRAEGLIYAGGVGVADRASARAADAETIYQIGSVTKMLTGTLAARLVAENRLDLGTPLAELWDDPARVPNGPDDTRITIQTLISHTAGMPRYPANLVRADGDPITGYSIEQMRDALANLTLTQWPGQQWEYSNFGYGVLSQALSRATGRPYPEALNAEVLAPLGMTETAFTLSDDMRARLATPYRDDDPNVATQPWDMGAMSAAGGLYSSVTDLARYAAWELSDEDGAMGARGIETRTLARAPLDRNPFANTMAWSFGRFAVDDFVDDHDAVWMGGDLDGYGAMVAILPDDDLAVIYLTNMGDSDPFEDFTKELLRAALTACGQNAG